MGAFEDNIDLIREVRCGIQKGDHREGRPVPQWSGDPKNAKRPQLKSGGNLPKDCYDHWTAQEDFWAAIYRKDNAKGRVSEYLAERALKRAKKRCKELEVKPRTVNLYQSLSRRSISVSVVSR